MDYQTGIWEKYIVTGDWSQSILNAVLQADSDIFNQTVCMCRLSCLFAEYTYAPAHNKTYNKTCATSEDSDQTAHPRSLIRFFADCMCLSQPPGYPKRDKRELLPYWWLYRLIFASHTGLIVGFLLRWLNHHTFQFLILSLHCCFHLEYHNFHLEYRNYSQIRYIVIGDATLSKVVLAFQYTLRTFISQYGKCPKNSNTKFYAILT